MSIITESNYGCIISHSDFINNVYRNTFVNTDSSCDYKIVDDLFRIDHPFKKTRNEIESKQINEKSKNRKRKHCGEIILDSEASQIKERFEAMTKTATLDRILPIDGNTSQDGEDNRSARQSAERCTTESLCLRGMEGCSGGNEANTPICQALNGCDIVLPPRCRFICGDVRTSLNKLYGELFDLIVLDPPWWNKYIRRSKAKRPENSYDMMYNSEIADLPIAPLVRDTGLVAVWCTNCAAHHRDVVETMFNRWGVKHKATWYWMKMTKFGVPMCPFTESTGKKPYERILIGSRDERLELPQEYIVASVPSALHSHKPPLNDVLRSYISTASPNCLEVFARYLLPNTTSAGYEPLRWQHTSLYRRIP